MYSSNLSINNKCPVKCYYYHNDVGPDDDYLIEWCDLGMEFEMLCNCPIPEDTTDGKFDGEL